MKNIIFDLGAVMFTWNPGLIAENFTDDVVLQNRIQQELYYHSDWMEFDCGIITEQEAIQRASKKFNLSEQVATELFEQTKASLVLIPETRELLVRVKEKKLNAYCLSNISPELFTYLSSRHDLFELFDGIVTSGVEKIGKPNRKIYEILLSRYQLNPLETLFIDDSPANTASAETLGITTVTFKGSKDCYNAINMHLE